MEISRKEAIQGAAGLAVTTLFSYGSTPDTTKKKTANQRFKHSVCKWAFNPKSLEEICEQALDIRIHSVELLDPEEIKIAQSYDLTCAMANQVPLNIEEGFNNPDLHSKLEQEYCELFPLLADLGITNVICFSGNRRPGLTDELGLEYCAQGLEPIVREASQFGITVSMELLNSKIDHPFYQCDHTKWGVQLCEKLGLKNFKLLYDIYHMQIMEGDIIRTITDNIEYISHFHTGGVPGRNEIDETQELNYSAIVKTINELDFNGFIAQEFIPQNEDVFASLKKGIEICSV